MEEKQLFQHLLEQLQINDKDLLQSLAKTEIDKVEILATTKQWRFFLKSEALIHPDVYKIFMHLLKETFEPIAHVDVWWRFEQVNWSDEVLRDYWLAALAVLAKDKPFVKAILNQGHHEVFRGVIKVGVPMEQQLETIQQVFHDVFILALQKIGIETPSIEYYFDAERHEIEKQNVQQRQSDEDKKYLVEALEAVEKKQMQQAKAETVVKDKDIPQIGKDITSTIITPIRDLPDNQFRQVIEGYVFDAEIREFRSGTQLLTLKITDYTSSVAVKLMSGRSIKKESFTLFKKGDWLRLEGDMVPDNYTGELDFRPRSIRHITKTQRQDKAPDGQKRVELHLHSNMSQMDATNGVGDLIAQAAKWGHPAVAITDHAGAQAFPDAYAAGKKHDIKVLYGIEAYVVNDGEPIAYYPQPLSLDEATYVVFDVETTGLSAVYDRIIELAAVKMQNGQVVDTFEAFINPGHPLSAFTTELTGITDAMLADAPSEEKVLKDFQAFSANSILVAHNASFDIGFLNKTYLRIGEPESTLPVIDTLELSRLVNPHLKGHRLNNLAKHYGILLEQHHRAVYDSETTGHILMKLLEQAKEQFQMVLHSDLNSQMGKGESYKNARPFHATILAKNQAGLKDLFKLISESNVRYFYRTPRIPRSLLTQHRQHLLIGTACSEGEIFTTMMQKGYDETAELVDYYDYIELQPPIVYETLIEQEQIGSRRDIEHIMRELVRLGEEKNIPVVATGNVHYLEEKDAIYREILIKSMKINQNRMVHLPQVHFRTTDEMLAQFQFLGEEKAMELVVTNTQTIADKIEPIEVIKKDLYTPNIPGSNEEIRQLSYNRAYELYGNPLPEIVEARIEKELKSIIDNGFAVIYLISQKLVHKSMEDGYLVGSRGSVGSSLVATMTGITEVNPLAPHYYCPECQYSEFFTQGEVGSGFDLPPKQCPHCQAELAREGQDIPFETFLGFYGDKVPDIDLNFSGEYQPRAHAYTKVLFGEDYVYRAGTISTVAEKTAFGYVKGYLEATGEQIPQAEKERLAKGIEGVKRTTGQHPGGIIVIPDYMDVFDFTPVQYPADVQSAEWRTTHFDFHSIHDNVLKLDILGHDDPTMIRKLQDLSGIDPKTIPMNDPGVMSLFSSPEVLGVTSEQIFSETGTLGVPEFGTNFVRGMLTETKPSTFAELLQISGLSHGTDVWLGNAQELIKNKVTTLAKVIGCRDDIMVTLMQYGIEDGIAFNIMESVRKGKGIPEDWQAIMRENKVPEWYIESCLKIKYMFPKAHAAAYIMMALRVAYFKVHYPMYYYAAYFSVRAEDFDLVAMHQGKEMVKRRLREIQGKGFDATVKERSLQTVLELANEMLERGFKFSMVDLEKSDADSFIIEDDTLIPPFRAIPGLGANVAQQIIKAREEAPFLSKEDLQRRGKVSKTIIEYLTEQGVLNHLPDQDQLSLF
ncbi:PolC-type DNA polymerase III [Tuanshanicoccus lijuaniae]|uniref:PolC-type DNA polymerase III n=1 Tax=Aerococcaceae bacterium zg-1292 TaxID=2774330 RepID=UPI001BD8A375|nr:PolC-type DNA polymerase III [Aerococcaceae bacterium zg-A91]MBS4458848.1 PolC-type DNA polymerase III [Aerococcaceae bacterium zg-BR33]